MPADLLIDDVGRTWQTGSAALLRSLHIERRDFDLTHYLIRNMGYVRLRASRGDARVTLYPRFLTKAAFEALVCSLVEQDCTRHIVENLDDPGRVEIIPGVEEAAARLADLAAAGGEVTRDDFYNEELSLDRLRDSRRLAPLAGMMRRWRTLQGSLDGSYESLFGDPALGGRVVVVRMLEGDQGVVEYAGSGFNCFDPEWRRSVIGRDIREQPDLRYGNLVAEAYTKTHHSKAPRLEFVEAVIRTPGCSLRRSRYDRLLLPWRLGNAMFVSAASVLRTSFSAASAI